MKTYDFILVYEHKVRELESLCLLKYELENRNYSVLIKCTSDMELFKSQQKIYKPKYHAKVLGVFACYNNDTLKLCVKNLISFDKVIDLQWEQMISRKQEKADSFRNFSGIGKEVVHIAWGEANALRLINVAGIDSKKVFQCGNISLDFLNKRFREYYYTREEINKIYPYISKKKICILFAGFHGAELDENRVKEKVAYYGKGWGEAQKIGKEVKATVLKWFLQASDEFEDYVFIYRPHPGENTSEVEKIFKDKSNIIINSDFSSKQWIWVSDFMFTWHSTTIIESLRANKMCYSLEPNGLKMPKEEDSTVFDGMKAIESYELFREVLKGKVIDNNLSVNEVNRVFGADGCGNTYKNVADAFIEIHKNPYYVLHNMIEEHSIYKKDYQSIKERIFGISIINELFWQYLKFRERINWIDESTRIYRKIKESNEREVASKKEISNIENKIKKLIN